MVRWGGGGGGGGGGLVCVASFGFKDLSSFVRVGMFAFRRLV